MLNAIQLFGLVLLGGLVAGEMSRQLSGLPRTTGYVLFGMLVGKSGFAWVTPQHIESAQLIIDLALGLILFELGYLVPRAGAGLGRSRILAGLAISLGAGLSLVALMAFWGHRTEEALFAAVLCIATSPAITIATCSDVGAKGERTGLLYTLVAVNGVVAFAGAVLVAPFLDGGDAASGFLRLAAASIDIALALLLGGACAALVLLGVSRLKREVEHQHLLILGTVVTGVGTAIFLGISVFLPMLAFGILVSALDRQRKVLAIRIASDARVFLVITFVLAGAALDILQLVAYWREALMIVLVRSIGQYLAILATRRYLALNAGEGLLTTIGLQPMSSIALVLLVDTQMLSSKLDSGLVGILMATILLMQLVGPWATQTAIKGYGEATALDPRRKNFLLRSD